MEFKSSSATYKVIEPISSREFAQVYKCNSKNFSDLCALKVIPKCPFLDVNQVKKEIEIQSTIHHQYFPDFIETFEDAKYYIIATQFIHGNNLSNFLKFKEHKLPEDRARKVMKQILEAINHLHNQGISHRNINLDNILIDNSDNITIIDFGSASNSINEYSINPKTEYSCFDHPDVILKHPTLGTSDDIWSLGVLLYYLITGKAPYNAVNHYDLVTVMNSGNVLKPSNMSNPCYNLLQKFLDRNTHYSVSLAQRHFWFSSGDKRTGNFKPMIGCTLFKMQTNKGADKRKSFTDNISQANINGTNSYTNYTSAKTSVFPNIPQRKSYFFVTPQATFS